ncbi:MAG: CBS domain-containing protein [Deltaproteobacteria bacterium]|nr:CBS domain-containing protein [Deltaproteobacteria bacterium]
MNVSEIAHTVLVTVTMDHTVGRARDIMKMKKIRHLLVMDGSELVGVITDRDVRSHLSSRIDTPIESSEDEKTLETKIHKVMTRDLITVSPDAPIGEAASLLLKHKIGCLPVIDKDGSAVGIVTDADFLGYLARGIGVKEDH